MDKTKIDWADASWNPVTGCLHGCAYCYARKIAERFSGCCLDLVGDSFVVRDGCGKGPIYELNNPVSKVDGIDPVLGSKVSKAPYPFGFSPTFHRYRLDIPARWTKPRTIFVCSMADLFGEWVPDAWIQEVFEACKAVPQHRYLFLTKNPVRYYRMAKAGILPKEDNFWYGSTATTNHEILWWAKDYNTFASIEPIMEHIRCNDANRANGFMKWFIVGAETGNRKNKVIPQKSWIDELAKYAADSAVPIFMKESLRNLMGADFQQEFPWEG